MSCDKSVDFSDDVVDPRVQIELERLNTATDEINKLEVDLDEARNQFRLVLAESTIKVDLCAKKLGNCIEKARPYYDARLKAKEALQETQKAAVLFERANSAHAAAKEMVYLAEEGLRTEGRTFDHAWQEMLNHATMRVNESESDRTASELEHRRTAQNYQKAESRVQTLQKDLKRAITKSRPYFELKIHYNQALQQQKAKIKGLEDQVGQVKTGYATALRNLEKISDEIHQTRQSGHNVRRTEDARLGAVSSDLSQTETVKDVVPNCKPEPKNKKDDGEIKKTGTPLSDNVKLTPNTPESSQPDTDVWSDSSYYTGIVPGDCEVNSCTNSMATGNDSSATCQSDTDSEDEYFRLPDKLARKSPTISHEGRVVDTQVVSAGGHVAEGVFVNTRTCTNPFTDIDVGICSFPKFKSAFHGDNMDQGMTSPCWTDIKLHSPEDEQFLTVKKKASHKNELEDEDFDIPYAPLPEMESEQRVAVLEDVEVTQKARLDSSLASWMAKKDVVVAATTAASPKPTPKKLNARRQSLDVLWNNATGEKVKEILSQGILKLSIASLTERRSSESKVGDQQDPYQMEDKAEGAKPCDASSYETNLTSQFGLQLFSKKNSKPDDDATVVAEDGKTQPVHDTFSNHLSGFIPKKERFFTKKVPSPLEKTLGYLNADEESNSDSESLTSIDMLTDEQLAVLVLDQDLKDIYQDILS